MVDSDCSRGGARLDWHSLKGANKEISTEMGTFFDSIPVPVFLLNSYLQIAYGNEAYVRRYSPGQDEALLGLRVGEVMDCPRSSLSLSGCGTSKDCPACEWRPAVVAAFNSGVASFDVPVECYKDCGMQAWNISRVRILDEYYVACVNVA